MSLLERHLVWRIDENVAETDNHLFTRIVCLHALEAGAHLAERLDDFGAADFYVEQAARLNNTLEQFWATNPMGLVTTAPYSPVSQGTSWPIRRPASTARSSSRSFMHSIGITKLPSGLTIPVSSRLFGSISARLMGCIASTRDKSGPTAGP